MPFPAESPAASSGRLRRSRAFRYRWRARTLRSSCATSCWCRSPWASPDFAASRSAAPDNPLLRLAALCRLMVTLLWAVHLPLLLLAPAFFSLSLAVGYGLHWIVFSWTVGHPVGLVHALLRTALVSAAWWLLPDTRVAAVAAAVGVHLPGVRLAAGSFEPARSAWPWRAGSRATSPLLKRDRQPQRATRRRALGRPPACLAPTGFRNRRGRSGRSVPAA